MLNIDLNTKELSKKYGLNEWIVKEETENIISKILTEKFKFEVISQFNGKPDSFEIYGYPAVRGQLIEVKISPNKINKIVFKTIISELSKALYQRSLFEYCETLKGTIKKVMDGTIKQIKGGNLFINIHGLSDRYENIITVCKREYQTPKERNKYIKDSVLFFHVSPLIAPFYDGVTPHIEIRLSRNSKKLTEGLIEKELNEKCLDIKVKCTKRIAGAYSLVKASHSIPKDVIKNVSNQLKERIIVKW
jgi:hypothetical protein